LAGPAACVLAGGMTSVQRHCLMITAPGKVEIVAEPALKVGHCQVLARSVVISHRTKLAWYRGHAGGNWS
jgi:hypothetical protein